MKKSAFTFNDLLLAIISGVIILLRVLWKEGFFYLSPVLGIMGILGLIASIGQPIMKMLKKSAFIEAVKQIKAKKKFDQSMTHEEWEKAIKKIKDKILSEANEGRYDKVIELKKNYDELMALEPDDVELQKKKEEVEEIIKSLK